MYKSLHFQRRIVTLGALDEIYVGYINVCDDVCKLIYLTAYYRTLQRN